MHTLLLVHLLVQPCSSKINSVRSLVTRRSDWGCLMNLGALDHMWCRSSVKRVTVVKIIKVALHNVQFGASDVVAMWSCHRNLFGPRHELDLCNTSCQTAASVWCSVTRHIWHGSVSRRVCHFRRLVCHTQLVILLSNFVNEVNSKCPARERLHHVWES